MADRVRIAVSETPIETITDENAGTHDIVASEVGKSLGGNGDSIALASYARTAAIQGFLNATPNYLDAVHTAIGALVSDDSGSDFFMIKNTGRLFSSVTELGAVSDDYVLIVISIAGWSAGVSGGWTISGNTSQRHYIEIAFLAPGQAIVLPLGASNKGISQFGAVASDLTPLNIKRGDSDDAETVLLYAKTVLPGGGDASDGNAVEFLAVT